MKGIVVIALPAGTNVCTFNIPKGTPPTELEAILNQVRRDFYETLNSSEESVISYDENDCNNIAAVSEPIAVLQSIFGRIGNPTITPNWGQTFLSAIDRGDQDCKKILVLLRDRPTSDVQPFLIRNNIDWLIPIARLFGK